ncbi:MAG: hypothetical protein GQ535_07530 [Rhodobacteraceae bacterium]|nr:hypothetical protein [Paracoccaceae bacterium]
MDINEIETNLLKLVREKGHVSFVEVARAFPDEEGDISLVMNGYQNIVYWWGLSSNVATAIENLRAAKKLFFVPSTPLLYAIDGVMSKMKIAKSLRQYKEPRWYPITLHHEPYRETK